MNAKLIDFCAIITNEPFHIISKIEFVTIYWMNLYKSSLNVNVGALIVRLKCTLFRTEEIKQFQPTAFFFQRSQYLKSLTIKIFSKIINRNGFGVHYSVFLDDDCLQKKLKSNWKFRSELIFEFEILKR